MTEPDMEHWIAEYLGTNLLFARILISIAVLLIIGFVRFLSLKIIFRRVKDPKERYHWRNGIKYTTVGIGIILIGFIWTNQLGSLGTFFGLLSAGLAIALKDPITNIAGWVFILTRRPFEVGDRVQIGNKAGDVIDIRFFQFTLNEIGNWVDADQSTGRIIHVPNGKVFTESQTNYNQGFSHIWNEIGVLITFESNWLKAKAILERILESHGADFTQSAKHRLLEASKKFMIYYNNLDPIVYTSVKDSGVMLYMRYLCIPNQRRVTENGIWQDVLAAFAKCDDIDFAYPTQRIYYNLKEGKASTIKKDMSGEE